ncbi:COMM domain-containing protein 2-like [Bolinopsis microptera]|uniref:COMM domain-containing protein 2-like n=1 Tax=Bolinopsis microptera TaxID=2820187 RepID=UPI0030799A8D
MLLVLSEQEKTSFTFLTSLPEQVYPDLVKTALSQLLSTKQITKVVNSAAAKLKVEVASLTNSSLYVLSQCLLNSAKRNLTPEDLTSSLKACGVEVTIVTPLVISYTENRDILIDIITRSTVQAPEYRSMEWRLECQVGSRSLHNTVIPNVLTKWKISDPRFNNLKTKETYLNCDVNTLQHITESLRAAQLELDTLHARKMCRNLARIG